MSKNIQLKIYPDTILREKALPVDNLKGNLDLWLESMARIMFENDGIGLAAPQVGVLKRIIIADIGEGLMHLINPEIIEKNGLDNLLIVSQFI